VHTTSDKISRNICGLQAAGNCVGGYLKKIIDNSEENEELVKKRERRVDLHIVGYNSFRDHTHKCLFE